MIAEIHHKVFSNLEDEQWNFDKRLSDHKGIVVEIESQRSVIT